MMKKTILSVIGFALISSGLFSQTYPLSENSWNNPDFVKRFLGSYGVLSGKEPEITSEDAELFRGIGERLNANDMQGAISLLNESIGPDKSAALDYTLGNIYLQNGDYAAGVKAYEGAIRKFPNFLRAYKNTGLAYIQMQNYEKGAEFIVKSVELGNQEGDSFGLLGYCYLNMGRNEAALDAYRLAGILAPNNKDWQIGKATALQRVGQYEEAIAKFDELIAKFPSNKTFYTAAANACLSLRDEQRAARYLELIRRGNNRDAQVLMLLGDIYLNQNLIPLAVGVYEDVLSIASSGDSERILRFARGLVAMGKYADAGAFIEQIQSSRLSLGSEQQKQILNLRSQIALAEGKSEEAVASLKQLIETDPLNGEALILLGEFYYNTGDNETALFYFERAQKIPSHQVEALIQSARVKVAQRQFADAIDLLQQAQAIKSQPYVEEYLEAIRNALKASA